MEQNFSTGELDLLVKRLVKMLAFDRVYKGGQGGIDIRGEYKQDMDEYLDSTKLFKYLFARTPAGIQAMLAHPTLKENNQLRAYFQDKIGKWFPNNPEFMSHFQAPSPQASPHQPTSSGTMPLVAPKRPQPPAASLEVNKLQAELNEVRMENLALLEEIARLNTIIATVQEQKPKVSEVEFEELQVAAKKAQKAANSSHNLVNTITGIFSVMFMNKPSVSFAEYVSAMTNVIRHIKKHNKETGDNLDVDALETLIK